MLYQIGNTIGPYTIFRELGGGAFGEVYLVEWNSKKGKKQGALKIINDPKFKEILKEVTTWARVSYHPNILSFFDAVEHDKQILLISEYAPDGSLVEWIRTYGGQENAVEVAVQLALGFLSRLTHLTAMTLCIAILNPQIFCTKVVRLCWQIFGFARGLDLVQSSLLAGTLAYMSPELINVYLTRAIGTDVNYDRTEADDLWASAVTFYEMLAGHRPFKTINDIGVSDPCPLPPHVPQELRDFVNKALHNVPFYRFPTAQDMYEALLTSWTDFKHRLLTGHVAAATDDEAVCRSR